MRVGFGKRIKGIAGVIAAFLLFTILVPQFAFAATAGTYKITMSINVRTGPSVNYSRLGTLSKNTIVEVSGFTNGWGKIIFKGKTGYVSGIGLSKVTAPVTTTTSTSTKPANGTPPSKYIGTAVCTASVSLYVRSAPSSSAKAIGTLKKNNVVYLLDKSSYWYKIQYGNLIGWSSSKYLKATLSTVPIVTTPTPKPTLKPTLTPSPKPTPLPSQPVTPPPTTAPPANKPLTGKVIFLDPGHGTGAGGSYGSYAEHVLVLSYALELKPKLEAAGATVYMTRTTSAMVNNYVRMSTVNRYTLTTLKDIRQKSLNTKKQESQTCETEIAAQTASISGLQSQRDTLQTRITKIVADITAKQSQIGTKQAELSDLETQRSGLLDQIALLDPDTEAAAIALLQDQLLVLTTQRDELSLQIATLQGEITTLKNEKSAKETNVAQINATIATHQKTLAAKNSLLQTITAGIAGLTADIAELSRLADLMTSIIKDPSLSTVYYDNPYSTTRPIHPDVKKIFEYQKDPALSHIIMVSIHTNGGGASGTVTYSMSNTYNPAYYTGYTQERSHALSQLLLTEMVSAAKFNNRGTCYNDFFMIRETNIASALIEVGFLDNTYDRKKLVDPSYKPIFANAMYNAILKYYTR